MGYATQAIRQMEKLYPNAALWQLDTIMQEEYLCRLYERIGYRKTGQVESVREGMDLVFYEKHMK